MYRIKKKHKNEYLLTQENLWVRNFTKNSVPYIDINKTIQQKDHFTFLKNEIMNGQARYPWVEKFHHRNIIIVSDGYDFKERQKLLEELPKDITIIGVNGVLTKWNIKKQPNYYVINNPYPQAMLYLPKNLKAPKCIASCRTNYNFLSNYKGIKYRYAPVNELSYNGTDRRETNLQIDDYRNPICASINLAYHFGAEKILLFCCDSVFKDKRDGAEILENGMYEYPVQKIAHGLIDGCCYWLKNKILTKDYSSGSKYENAQYIKDIFSFFEGSDD